MRRRKKEKTVMYKLTEKNTVKSNPQREVVGFCVYVFSRWSFECNNSSEISKHNKDPVRRALNWPGASPNLQSSGYCGSGTHSTHTHFGRSLGTINVYYWSITVELFGLFFYPIGIIYSNPDGAHSKKKGIEWYVWGRLEQKTYIVDWF